MRDRFRAQVRDDIKRAALRQLADSGPQGLSINAIAKELGVSGPALYRYFAGRDELLTELIVDAYRDLADAVEGAADVRAFAHAYRGWAVEQPHRYRLLFGPPLPGYDAHAERLVDASERSMATLLELLRQEPPAEELAPPSPALARQLDRWAAPRGGADSHVALRAVGIWARLHGLVSLEIAGNFDSMGLDAGAIFEAHSP